MESKLLNLNYQTQKRVFVAWTNTDLTEGRGTQYPLCVCDQKSTAIRISRGKYIMGSDCPVTEQWAYQVNGLWYVPGNINPGNAGDIAIEQASREKENILQRLKEAGFSERDINILTGK